MTTMNEDKTEHHQPVPKDSMKKAAPLSERFMSLPILIRLAIMVGIAAIGLVAAATGMIEDAQDELRILVWEELTE